MTASDKPVPQQPGLTPVAAPTAVSGNAAPQEGFTPVTVPTHVSDNATPQHGAERERLPRTASDNATQLQHGPKPVGLAIPGPDYVNSQDRETLRQWLFSIGPYGSPDGSSGSDRGVWGPAGEKARWEELHGALAALLDTVQSEWKKLYRPNDPKDTNGWGDSAAADADAAHKRVINYAQDILNRIQYMPSDKNFDDSKQDSSTQYASFHSVVDGLGAVMHTLAAGDPHIPNSTGIQNSTLVAPTGGKPWNTWQTLQLVVGNELSDVAAGQHQGGPTDQPYVQSVMQYLNDQQLALYKNTAHRMESVYSQYAQYVPVIPLPLAGLGGSNGQNPNTPNLANMPNLAGPVPLPNIGLGPAPGFHDPTGLSANPLIDPKTGKLVDPSMAPLIDPNTGKPIDPNTALNGLNPSVLSKLPVDNLPTNLANLPGALGGGFGGTGLNAPGLNSLGPLGGYSPASSTSGVPTPGGPGANALNAEAAQAAATRAAGAAGGMMYPPMMPPGGMGMNNGNQDGHKSGKLLEEEDAWKVDRPLPPPVVGGTVGAS